MNVMLFSMRDMICVSLKKFPPPSPFTLMGHLYDRTGSCVQRAMVSFTLRPSRGSEARHKGQETPVSRSLTKAVSEGVLQNATSVKNRERRVLREDEFMRISH